jgi:hypothetical protein
MLLEDFPAIDKTNFAKVHPASFVLTNLSNRAIVALARKIHDFRNTEGLAMVQIR